MSQPRMSRAQHAQQHSAAERAAAEQREREQQMALMQTIVAQEEVKQAQSSALRLTERCFADCVHNFRSRSLENKEELCASRCIDKFRGAYDRLLREWNVMDAERRADQDTSSM